MIVTKIYRSHPEDLTQLLPLFSAYRRFYDQLPDSAAESAYLEERLLREDTVLFHSISETGNQLTGFVHLFPIFSSVGLRRHWLLNDLYVSENYRCRGLGKELIRHAQHFATETGSKGLLLQTGIENHDARRLYERMGFMKDTKSFYYEWTC